MSNKTPPARELPSNETGLALIAKERKRQIEIEGWSPEHDDSHSNGELARAAACYAMGRKLTVLNGYLTGVGFEGEPKYWQLWPWNNPDWWKPSNDPIRNLVKAGALIAAEIDRRLRVQGSGILAPQTPVDSSKETEKSAIDYHEVKKQPHLWPFWIPIPPVPDASQTATDAEREKDL